MKLPLFHYLLYWPIFSICSCALSSEVALQEGQDALVLGNSKQSCSKPGLSWAPPQQVWRKQLCSCCLIHTLDCQHIAVSWDSAPELWVLRGTSSFSICLNLCLCTLTWYYFARLYAEHPLGSRKSKEVPALCFAQLLIIA